MDYEKGYVYELMDQGGPTDVREAKKPNKCIAKRHTMYYHYGNERWCLYGS